MGTYRTESTRRVTEQTAAERIMRLLRKRRDGGLPAGMTAGAIAGALKLELPAVRAALGVLVTSGKAVRDAGPQGLADTRVPDRWHAA